jgi:predicted transcriptional regulator
MLSIRIATSFSVSSTSSRLQAVEETAIIKRQKIGDIRRTASKRYSPQKYPQSKVTLAQGADKFR